MMAEAAPHRPAEAADLHAARAGLAAAQGRMGRTPDTEGLKDANPRVRAQAVRAMGRFESPALVGQIVALLLDTGPAVRQAAAEDHPHQKSGQAHPAMIWLVKCPRSLRRASRRPWARP